MRFPTIWYVLRAFASRLNVLCVKLLAEHYLEFLSVKGGCTGLSEYTLVKMPHGWIQRVAAQMGLKNWLCEINTFAANFIKICQEIKPV